MSKENKKVLLISHEFTMTGAPIALFYLAVILKNINCTVTFAAPEKGALEKEIRQENFEVYIDPLLAEPQGQSLMAYFLTSDLIVVSTLVSSKIVNFLKDKNVPVLWWIHEAKNIYELGYADNIPLELGENIRVYCGGQYAKDNLVKVRPNYNPEILLYYTTDIARKKQRFIGKTHGKGKHVSFAIVGTVSWRKGQDILADAIRYLSDEDRSKSRFYFVGRMIDKDVFDSVQQLEEQYPENVHIVEEMPLKKLLSFYKKMDCIICASRDDTMPVVLTENMMLSTPCICSENSGTAALIVDGYNGFVYRNNDSLELCCKISYFVNHFGSLNEKMQKRSRKIYEDNFSKETITNQLLGILKQLGI